MMRMSAASSVPAPSTAARRRCANQAGAFSTHSTGNDTHFTYPDLGLQRLIVQPFVLARDRGQVQLGAGHHDADERAVVRAEPLHGVAQARGEPRRRALRALHWKRDATGATLLYGWAKHDHIFFGKQSINISDILNLKISILKYQICVLFFHFNYFNETLM